MTSTTVADELRARRTTAGLSQRALALRSGVPQPNITAYETGRRIPSAGTLDRLAAILDLPTLERLRSEREQIIEAARRRRLSDVRVFGSVARGQAGPGSDVDLLVHPAPDASVFDLAGFMAEVEQVLGVGVDVVSDRGNGPAMDRIRAEAVPL
jgi:predicted nucleotidyltransferase